MSVIEASSAGVKDMADGSLRITFEFEPRHAAEAFALFGPRGRAVAVAALKDGAGSVDKSPNLQGQSVDRLQKMQDSAPKGGEWAKLAGMWCSDDDFYEFIRPRYDHEMGGNGLGHGDIEVGVDVKDIAAFCAHAIKFMCEIDSRALLDHDTDALRRFNERVRFPFMKHMQARGISN